MKGLGEIIRHNAIEHGREGFSFTIHIDVNPTRIEGVPEQPLAVTLQDELESWLESLDYVNRYAVRRKF